MCRTRRSACARWPWCRWARQSASIAALEYDDAVHDNADALSRVIQGVVQGVLAGIGFTAPACTARSGPRKGRGPDNRRDRMDLRRARHRLLDAWLLVITGTVLAFGILQALPVIEQKALPLPRKRKKPLAVSFRLVDQAHMGRHDAPAFRNFHRLHLPCRPCRAPKAARRASKPLRTRGHMS